MIGAMEIAPATGAAPLWGAGPVAVLRDPAPIPGSADLDRAVADFRGLSAADAPVVRFARCRPTAAFSRRDTHLPGYPAAVELLQAKGFEPVIRPVGGRLALYDEGSLVVHGHAGHPDPRAGITERFQAFAETVAAALTHLGVPDVGVGQVPGEYCEGTWSVNAGGVQKLAGTGQRLGRNGYLFSAVLAVTGADRLRGPLAEAYRVLGLDLRPESVGSVDAAVPGVHVATVEDLLAAGLVRMIGDAGRAVAPAGQASV